jgi:hypothetical protein
MATPRPQPYEGPGEDLKRAERNLFGLADAGSRMLEVFLRREGTFGSRYHGLNTVLSWVFMASFGPLFFPRHDQRPLYYAWLCATALLLVHRAAHAWRVRRGEMIHSRSAGERYLPVSAANEAFLAFGAGGFLCLWNAPLGTWLCVSACCMAVSNAWVEDQQARTLEGLRDRELEMRWLRSRYRNDE